MQGRRQATGSGCNGQQVAREVASSPRSRADQPLSDDVDTMRFAEYSFGRLFVHICIHFVLRHLHRSLTPLVEFADLNNPSRGDDALGIGTLLLERRHESGADAAGDFKLLTDFQLQVEHALDLGAGAACSSSTRRGPARRAPVCRVRRAGVAARHRGRVVRARCGDEPGRRTASRARADPRARLAPGPARRELSVNSRQADAPGAAPVHENPTDTDCSRGDRR